MAKTRAQRKAERRRRQQAEQRRRQSDPAAAQEERAQEDTQQGVSGEVAEAEAVLRTGAQTEEYGERTEERDQPGAGDGSPVPGVMPAPVQPETAPEPEAPAPSRADVGRPAAEPEAPAEPRESRRERRRDPVDGRSVPGRSRCPERERGRLLRHRQARDQLGRCSGWELVSEPVPR